MDSEQLARGKPLENTVAKKIKQTALHPYTFHDISLLLGYNNRCQIDHLILLPHKVVIIEDKIKKDAEDCKIFYEFDCIKYDRYDTYSSFNSAKMVSQVERAKSILGQVLAPVSRNKLYTIDIPPLRVYKGTKDDIIETTTIKVNTCNFTLEAIACVRCDEIESFQTRIPVYSEDTLWFYLKALEAELQAFNKTLIKLLFDDKLSELNKHRGGGENKLKHTNKHCNIG